MIRNKIILVLFCLFAITFFVIFRQFRLLQEGANIIKESVKANEGHAPGMGATYKQYIRRSNMANVTSEQQKFIEANAFVVNENAVNEVKRLKELKPDQLPTAGYVFDSLKDSPANLLGIRYPK